jgi:hypothetical protein
MNTESRKGADKEAWENIEICCQTLCDKEIVVEYIRKLELENQRLKSMLETATKYGGL